MRMLGQVGVLAHPLRAETAPVAHQIAAALRARKVAAWCYTEWDEARQVLPAADLVVAIGGDGAMLRAARACARTQTPVLGINMGQLGFLTEFSREDWQNHLEALLAQQYWIEERMMIRASILDGEQVLASGDALNDVVISGGIARMIQLETWIDGGWATTYSADALIIATPTGSTAYALACGGPILPPTLHNILIVPLAPHLSMDRPIVLSEGAQVDVIATPRSKIEIDVIVDGATLGAVLPHQRVRVQASPHISRFARLRERNYFYRSLLDRLEPRVERTR
jgi:NAD+ kinase